MAPRARLSIPRQLSVAVFCIGVASVSCGDGDSPDAGDMRADAADAGAGRYYCLPDGTTDADPMCPTLADAERMCPPGCRVVA